MRTANDGVRSDPPRLPSRRIGQLIGESYRLLRFLGAGGSGDVYEAEHVRLGKSFAVKLHRLDASQPASAAKRFQREARAIAKIASEHVVSIVDSGELEDGTPYLVMELLQGEELRALLRREKTLPVRRAVHLLLDACAGLEKVHAAGLVHRDIKPENLFITRRDGGEDWCKLLDFGIAKMESSQATAHGAIVGTVRYMAPEQLADTAAIGPATDIHALGLVLYECLAGAPAYAADSVPELMYRIMNVEPVPLSQHRPELPGAVVDLVTRCLQKVPERRPASAAELASALRESVALDPLPGDATLGETRGFAPPPSPRTARHRWALPAAATLAVTGWGYGLAVSRDRASAEKAPALTPRADAPPSPEEPSVAATIRSTTSAPTLGERSTVAPPPPVNASAAASAPNPDRQVRVTPRAGSEVRTRRDAKDPEKPRELSVGHFDKNNPYGD